MLIELDSYKGCICHELAQEGLSFTTTTKGKSCFNHVNAWCEQQVHLELQPHLRAMSFHSLSKKLARALPQFALLWLQALKTKFAICKCPHLSSLCMPGCQQRAVECLGRWGHVRSKRNKALRNSWIYCMCWVDMFLHVRPKVQHSETRGELKGVIEQSRL